MIALDTLFTALTPFHARKLLNFSMQLIYQPPYLILFLNNLRVDIVFLYKLWNFQIPFNFAEIEYLFVDKIAKAVFDVLECFVFIKVLSQVIFSSQPNILHRVLFWCVRCEQ